MERTGKKDMCMKLVDIELENAKTNSKNGRHQSRTRQDIIENEKLNDNEQERK